MVFSSCPFPLLPAAIMNQGILLSVTHTQLKMDAIHLKSLNPGTNHDYVHPSYCMAKIPSPPATHIHTCFPQSTVQTLIQLSSVCVYVFLIHTKTCIITHTVRVCTCPCIHTVCCIAVVSAFDCGRYICVCAMVLCCVLWNG